MTSANLKLDIRNLADKAALFQYRIDAVCANTPHPDFEWYPYDSLGSFYTLAGLLTGERRYLLDLIGDKPVLDVGCGDGHISFFLESLGCKVIAVDNPRTNFNHMQGVKALKAALNSSVEIIEQDIDYQFRLPDTQCSVTFLLGILYHLKNPFQALEMLWAHSQYCLLSTRVTRFSAEKAADLSAHPVAYLVDRSETNDDATNYWIFTNPGLKRLIERSGWQVLDYTTIGNTTDSDPVTAEGDERAFCLASRTAGVITNGLLVSGWHEQAALESWRWTERRFSAVFSEIARDTQHTLSLDFFLPAAIEEAFGTVELAASVSGYALPAQRFGKAGQYRYSAPVPEAALIDRPAVVEFTLNKALAPTERDRRELGLIVSSVRLS